MPLILPDLLARGHVPEPDRAVEAGRRQGLAVRAPGDRVDGLRVAVERPDRRSLLRHRQSGRRHRHQYRARRARISSHDLAHAASLRGGSACSADRDSTDPTVADGTSQSAVGRARRVLCEHPTRRRSSGNIVELTLNMQFETRCTTGSHAPRGNIRSDALRPGGCAATVRDLTTQSVADGIPTRSVGTRSSPLPTSANFGL